MGEIVLPPLIPADDYSETEGKLAASLKWLIFRVYEQEKAIPDKLRNGIFRDDTGRLLIDPAVLSCLTNGSLYSQAAAKIFKEPHLVMQSHGAVLAALMDYGIDVFQRPEEGGQQVQEAELACAESFQTLAHLAMIDALMLAHLRNVITVERVVEAVSRHTSVDDRERPMDSADALLFWINKICLLIRDEVERSQIMLKGTDDGAMIPEMEDLYDDISDGQCLCALVAFYRPREMEIQEISFNDQMSNPDCQYNIMLLREFCRNSLITNPFHFEIEDFLYLHDSLQMNMNIFLADLFDSFEPLPAAPSIPEQVQSPRRFVPIQAIPDLRAANIAARSQHPPRVRNPFSNVQVNQTTPTRSMSMMSQDSLLTNRTNDSWRANQFQHSPEHWGANVTNFGQLQQADHGSNGNLSQTGGGGQYVRSDSLPAASVRLQLEEKRREHEKRKLLQSTANESERAEKSKAAFFAVMNQARFQSQEPANQNSKMMQEMMEKMERLQEQFEQMTSARMPRAASQPSVYQDVQPASARADFSGTMPHGGYHQQQQGFDPYYGNGYQRAQDHYAQPQIRSSQSNGMINYLPGQVPSEYQQPFVQGQYQQPAMMQQQQPMPGFTLNPMHQSAHAATGFSMSPQQGIVQPPPYAQLPTYAPPMEHLQSSPYHQPPSLAQQQQQQQAYAAYAGTPDSLPPTAAAYDMHNGGTFRLHSNEPSNSRLDPQLELNRNLTNWGMTMKVNPSDKPARRQWENQTFIKSDMDRVNHPDLVPVVPDNDGYQQQRKSPSIVGTIRRSRDSRGSRDESFGGDQEKIIVHDPEQSAPQASPPRDPGTTQPPPANGSSHDTQKPAPLGPAFVVTDGDEAPEDYDKIAEQRREAKRAALLAKTMKRKEESGNKNEAVEQRNMEKRLAEEAKREMAEQKKIENELRRQKILDDYKKKKAENELGEPSSARVAGTRGHSQPPIVRTKSQMSEAAMSGPKQQRVRGASTVERVPVQSLQEPTHKLFAKTNPKSNRGLMVNALQYSIFPGPVNDSVRTKTMNDLACSSAKHFLVLFRDHKCQYRGLYSWDQTSDTAEKISGQGPSKCTEAMMFLMFKYDSGAKSFSQIPTKHLGATIDGFSIQDSYWQKPKIPHSKHTGTTANHKNN